MSFEKLIIFPAEMLSVVRSDPGLLNRFKCSYAQVVSNEENTDWILETGVPIALDSVVQYGIGVRFSDSYKVNNPGWGSYIRARSEGLSNLMKHGVQINLITNAINFYSNRSYDYLLVEPADFKFFNHNDAENVPSRFSVDHFAHVTPMVKRK